MPLPDFIDQPGHPVAVLPPGVHPCAEPDCRERLVDQFGESARRPRIWDGFLRLRAALRTTGLSVVQWVDGSFVEAKPEPGDADVVSFVDAEALNSLPPDDQAKAGHLLAGGEETKPAFLTHTFLVPCVPPGGDRHEVYEASRLYWRRWFGRTRGRVAKGIVRLDLSGAGPLPLVSADGEADA